MINIDQEGFLKILREESNGRVLYARYQMSVSFENFLDRAENAIEQSCRNIKAMRVSLETNVEMEKWIVTNLPNVYERKFRL